MTVPTELSRQSRTARPELLPRAVINESLRILVAEDDDINRLVIGGVLDNLGYRYTIVEDGYAAVSAALKDHFSLILMDLQMPGMSGYEATSRIRQIGGWNALVPIVALTAHAQTEVRPKIMASEMQDHLTKPFSPAELEAVVDRWTTPARVAI